MDGWIQREARKVFIRGGKGVRKISPVPLSRGRGCVLVVGGWGPVKVPELVPRRDIFERPLRASPPGFPRIYGIGIPSGCGNLACLLEALHGPG